MRRHVSQSAREIGIKGWKDFVVAYFACNPSGSPPTPFFPYRVRKPKSFRGSMSSTLLCPHRDQARFSATEIGNRTSRYFNLRIVSPLKRLLCTKPWNKVTCSPCAQAAPFFLQLRKFWIEGTPDITSTKLKILFLPRIFLFGRGARSMEIWTDLTEQKLPESIWNSWWMVARRWYQWYSLLIECQLSGEERKKER